MASTPHMPARGARSAPAFDPAKPRELRRFFSDLDYLFAASAIEDEAEKKKYAVRYVDTETAEFWEGLPTYSNAEKNYEAFRAEIYAF